jgi:hypothetical protein
MAHAVISPHSIKYHARRGNLIAGWQSGGGAGGWQTIWIREGPPIAIHGLLLRHTRGPWLHLVVDLLHLSGKLLLLVLEILLYPLLILVGCVLHLVGELLLLVGQRLLLLIGPLLGLGLQLIGHLLGLVGEILLVLVGIDAWIIGRIIECWRSVLLPCLLSGGRWLAGLCPTPRIGWGGWGCALPSIRWTGHHRCGIGHRCAARHWGRGWIGGPLWCADKATVGSGLIDHASSGWCNGGPIRWRRRCLAASQTDKHNDGNRNRRQAKVRAVCVQSLRFARLLKAMGSGVRHDCLSAGKAGLESSDRARQ